MKCSKLLSVLVIAMGFALVGCASNETMNNLVGKINNGFHDAEFVIDPSLENVATFSQLELQGSRYGSSAFSAVGHIVYRKSACKRNLTIHGKFVGTEGQTLAAASGIIAQYEKGDDRKFTFRPSETVTGAIGDPKIGKIIIKSVECG